MAVAIMVIVILAMILAGAWVLHRLGQQQHEGIATHRFSRGLRPPGERGPQLPVLPPSWNGDQSGSGPLPPTQAALPDAVHNGRSTGDNRRDHRDGGRGRRPTRRHTVRLSATGSRH